MNVFRSVVLVTTRSRELVDALFYVENYSYLPTTAAHPRSQIWRRDGAFVTWLAKFESADQPRRGPRLLPALALTDASLQWCASRI